MEISLANIQRMTWRNRDTKQLHPKILDSLSQAGIRISFTRDLRKDLASPEHIGIKESTQQFGALFSHDPRIIHREIVNWNLAESEDASSPHFFDMLQQLPDYSLLNISISIVINAKGLAAGIPPNTFFCKSATIT